MLIPASNTMLKLLTIWFVVNLCFTVLDHTHTHTGWTSVFFITWSTITHCLQFHKLLSCSGWVNFNLENLFESKSVLDRIFIFTKKMIFVYIFLKSFSTLLNILETIFSEIILFVFKWQTWDLYVCTYHFSNFFL